MHYDARVLYTSSCQHRLSVCILEFCISASSFSKVRSLQCRLFPFPISLFCKSKLLTFVPLCVGVRFPYWQIQKKKLQLNQSFVILLHKSATSPCLLILTVGFWLFRHSTVCTSHSFPRRLFGFGFCLNYIHNKTKICCDANVYLIPTSGVPSRCNGSRLVWSRSILIGSSSTWASWVVENGTDRYYKLNRSVVKPHTFDFDLRLRCI